MDLSSVRIREHFGLVSNNTQTGQFCFLVSPPKNRASVEKHDFVLVDHPILGEVCQVLAEVTEITSYEEVAGSTIGDKMGKMLATADILGYVDLRKQQKPLRELLVPPCSGCRVYIPFKMFLEDVLNRNIKGQVPQTPIEFGVYEASSTEDQQTDGRVTCYLDAQELVSRHTIISAMAGAGKTYTARRLIGEMLAKTAGQILIIDPYGEYAEIGKRLEIRAKMDKETYAREIKKNQVTSLTAYGLLEEKRSLYLEALNLLLRLRLEEKIPPTFLLIEHADILKGETLNQLVLDGKKTGVFICLLTAHPSELGGQVLSQMGIQLVGRTLVKEDLETLAYMGAPAAVLSKLRLGEWIINGVNVNRPIKLTVK
jgi:hypothetical protein